MDQAGNDECKDEGITSEERSELVRSRREDRNQAKEGVTLAETAGQRAPT